MDNTTVSGRAHITFVRQGDSISSMLISTKALIQFVNDAGAATPDWSVEANQPVIYPRVVSQLTGSTVTAITSPSWKVDGVSLVFGSNSKTNDGMYESTTYTLSGVAVPALKICGNIMASATQNKVVSFSGTVTTGGFSTVISADISVSRNESAGEVYTGYITAFNGGIVDDTNTSTTLTATLMKGGTVITSGITYKWYYNTPADTDAEKDNWEPVTNTLNTLGVSRDEVDTLRVYKCDFVISGNVVASAFFEVRDDSDPLYIIPNPNQKEELLSSYQSSITYTPLVRRRGQSKNEAGWSFTYVLSDAKGSTVRSGTGTSFTVTYTEMQTAGTDLDLLITATK